MGKTLCVYIYKGQHQEEVKALAGETRYSKGRETGKSFLLLVLLNYEICYKMAYGRACRYSSRSLEGTKWWNSFNKGLRSVVLHIFFN